MKSSGKCVVGGDVGQNGGWVGFGAIYLSQCSSTRCSLCRPAMSPVYQRRIASQKTRIEEGGYNLSIKLME